MQEKRTWTTTLLEEPNSYSILFDISEHNIHEFLMGTEEELKSEKKLLVSTLDFETKKVEDMVSKKFLK